MSYRHGETLPAAVVNLARGLGQCRTAGDGVAGDEILAGQFALLTDGDDEVRDSVGVAGCGEGAVAGPGMLGCIERLVTHTSPVCGAGGDVAALIRPKTGDPHRTARCRPLCGSVLSECSQHWYGIWGPEP